MSVSDNRISDWSTTLASNPPSDGTSIARGDLARQLRNYKSVIRTQSWDKEFEKLSYTATGSSSGATGAVTFPSANGDLTATFTEGRKVLFVYQDDTYIYCSVLLSSFSTHTTLTLTQLDGLIGVGQEYEVYVGIGNLEADPLPAFFASGSTTITGTNTNTTVNLSQYGFATPDYFVKVTPISTDSTATGAYKVSQLYRGAANFTVHLYTAPGVGKTTTLGWVMLRPTSTV